jgi:hypothetical protein
MRLIALLILLLTITSLKGQVTISPTTIKANYKVGGCQNGYQPADTVRIDLDKISINDTLILIGKIMECGEWGGHEEYIIICRRNQNLICWMGKGSSDCPKDFFDRKNRTFGFPKAHRIGENIEPEKTIPPPEVVYDTIIIQDEQKSLITNYFKEFGIISLKCDINSNAPTYYKIIYNLETIYNREDPSGHWKGFIDLRDKIFKKK